MQKGCSRYRLHYGTEHSVVPNTGRLLRHAFQLFKPMSELQIFQLPRHQAKAPPGPLRDSPTPMRLSEAHQAWIQRPTSMHGSPNYRTFFWAVSALQSRISGPCSSRRSAMRSSALAEQQTAGHKGDKTCRELSNILINPSFQQQRLEIQTSARTPAAIARVKIA